MWTYPKQNNDKHNRATPMSDVHSARAIVSVLPTDGRQCFWCERKSTDAARIFELNWKIPSFIKTRPACTYTTLSGTS